MKRIVLNGLVAVATLSTAQAEEIPVPPSLENGFGNQIILGSGDYDPPVIARERLTVEVLPETGRCASGFWGYHPCPVLRFPDGSERSTDVINFSRPGPLTIELDHLTYGPRTDGLIIADQVLRFYEYVGETEYRDWTREEWGPCPGGGCDLYDGVSGTYEVHPVYSIPYPERVSREFIDVEYIGFGGSCASYSFGEERSFECDIVRLPEGDVIEIDVGGTYEPGELIYMERLTYAEPHPLLAYDRYDFTPYRRPSQ